MSNNQLVIYILYGFYVIYVTYDFKVLVVNR